MSKQLDLKKTNNLIHSFSNRLKTETDAIEAKKIKNRLLETRETLQGHLEIMYRDINALQNDSSEKLQKAKQIAGHEANKIKSLINEVNSALDSCRRIMEKLSNHTKTPEADNYTPLDNESNPLKLSKVTSQTIALLDTERYGTETGHGIIIEYPKPDLGLPIKQRNRGIADKIRLGLRSYRSGEGGNHQITMPKCYHNFSEGKI